MGKDVVGEDVSDLDITTSKWQGKGFKSPLYILGFYLIGSDVLGFEQVF